MDYVLKLMNIAFTMMNSVLKMMNSVLKMMDFVLKMMIHRAGALQQTGARFKYMRKTC